MHSTDLDKHDSLTFGASHLQSANGQSILSVPLDLRGAFAPATHCLYEWMDYWLDYPGADRLVVGNTVLKPVVGSLFRIRFENQLGLTSLQPFAGSVPLYSPLQVEVISPKFPSPLEHLHFFRALLDDLFARAARLPFTISAPTARRATEALRPPTPLFILYFLQQHTHELGNALTAVQSAPFRHLRDQASFVPLAAADAIDADVLVGILQAPQELVRTDTLTVSRLLQGYAPTRVLQRQSEESLDTVENRFILAFLREMLVAAEGLPNEPWWGNVPSERQAVARSATRLIHSAVTHPMFDEVGAKAHFPAASQVLQRRDGYRELLQLWQVFHHARRPLFETLRLAIDVRDIAQLYEFWVFFALIQDIGSLLDKSPVINLAYSDARGLRWHAEAHYGSAGRLVYNANQPSYSVALRPDFTWLQGDRPQVVFDAKFRFERPKSDNEHDEDSPEATARRADIYKMHTYRDALNVRAAVSVYPGDVTIFYHRDSQNEQIASLCDILMNNASGIGALARRPNASE
jgi:uncharacterized protein